MNHSACVQDPPEIASPHNRQTKTILVVDDDPLLLDLAALILAEERCYRVLCASSGRQALQIAAQTATPPDLLLLDYSMPGMTGLELYDLLHTQAGYERIPAIMVSASLPPAEELAKRHLLGVQKPYDIDTLTGQIKALTSAIHKTLV